jgi:hypothetical protein
LAELLRADLQSRGEKLTTFGSAVDHLREPTLPQAGSTPLTHAVNQTTAIATRNPDGTLNAVGRIPLQKFGITWGSEYFPYQPFDN